MDRTHVTKAAFQLSAIAPSDPEVTVDGVSGQKGNAMGEETQPAACVESISQTSHGPRDLCLQRRSFCRAEGTCPLAVY